MFNKQFGTLCLCLFCSLSQSAISQETSTYNPSLQNLLNKVDSPSVWAAAPVSGIPSADLSNQSLMSPSSSQFQHPINIAPNNSAGSAQPANTFFTKQQILRGLLGGNIQSTNSSNGSKQTSSSGSAYSDYQEAENQASRARDAEERAHYEEDKWTRQNDASDAHYAANAARQASDRVYDASLNGDNVAKQYAGSARAAADRARAAADQARYYADTAN